jgi:hypothetical protein
MTDFVTTQSAKRTDLVFWLQKELSKQAQVDISVSTHNLDPQTIPEPSAFQPPDASKPRQDYFAIITDNDIRHKGKHKQRTMIIQKAQENVKVAAAAAATAPVCEYTLDR